MVLDLVVSTSGFLEMVGAFSKIDAIQKNLELIQTESDEDRLHIKVVCIVEIYNFVLPPFQIVSCFGFCRCIVFAMHLDIHLCLDT
jgi:hypothetical protein